MTGAKKAAARTQAATARVSRLRARLGGQLWRQTPRGPILAVFAVVAMSLIGGVLLILGTIRAERHEREIADHSSAVLTVLRDISRDAVNAETGQRGFYITLDKRYLAPYAAALAQHEPSIARLRALTAGSPDPRQRELAAAVAQLSDAKFAEVGEVIAQIQKGDLFGAQRRILSDEGQDVMERLRRAIAGMEAIEQDSLTAAHDRAVATEARMVPLMLVLLVLISTTLGLGLWLVVRNADAEALAAHAGQLAAARDRADLLANELNHRVKNLFAVVLAIIQMSGRDSPEAQPALERIADRVRALLKAHAMTQGENGGVTARLDGLVETVIAPYRSENAHCTIEGPSVALSERQVVPVGLVLHELVTNAVKYGAWSQPGGDIAIRWELAGDKPHRLRLEWREHCDQAPEPSNGKRGFGSMLLQSSARQLDGEWTRELEDDGIAVTLSFPLEEPAA